MSTDPLENPPSKSSWLETCFLANQNISCPQHLAHSKAMPAQKSQGLEACNLPFPSLGYWS